jgi:hypothetical protein
MACFIGFPEKIAEGMERQRTEATIARRAQRQVSDTCFYTG